MSYNASTIGTYNTGTVNVVKNSNIITGVETIWKEIINPGDIFTLNDDKIYIISEVIDNTHVKLDKNFIEKSANNSDYRIILSTAAHFPSDTAAKVAKALEDQHQIMVNDFDDLNANVQNNWNELVAGYNVYKAELTDLKNAAASSASSATASKNAAETAANNASQSETNALSSKNAAANSASAAHQSKTDAANFASSASSSASSATASKNAAAASASNAAQSAANAAQSESNAAISANNAANVVEAGTDVTITDENGKRKVSVTPDTYLKLSGGTMNGSIINNCTYAITKTVTDSFTCILGGSTEATGGNIILCGVDRTSYKPGAFVLSSVKTDGSSMRLIGDAINNSLTWNNKNIITETGGALTENVYVKYDDVDVTVAPSSDQRKTIVYAADVNGISLGTLQYYHYTNGSNGVRIVPRKADGTVGTILALNEYPDGTSSLTYGPNKLVYPIVSFYGVEYLSSGLQIVYGYASMTSTNKTITFARSFSGHPKVFLTPFTDNNTIFATCLGVSNTNFTAKTNSTTSANIFYLAIGRGA